MLMRQAVAGEAVSIQRVWLARSVGALAPFAVLTPCQLRGLRLDSKSERSRSKQCRLEIPTHLAKLSSRPSLFEDVAWADETGQKLGSGDG